MNSVWVFAATLLLVPIGSRPQTPADSTGKAVGTYDRSSIVLAYYRSPLWAAILADRRFEMDTVKAAHDDARAKELEKWGEESQERAMHQLTDNAPLDNIVAVLQPEFRELTARLTLSRVVDSKAVGPGVATVDVTPQLMDWLRATAETRKMALALHNQHPSN